MKNWCCTAVNKNFRKNIKTNMNFLLSYVPNTFKIYSHSNP